uniref:Uncharacterized protein n=1 Tax=viral metagenome TaxID=1070528 RepID=A0A6C0JB11_9ZZZZ
MYIVDFFVFIWFKFISLFKPNIVLKKTHKPFWCPHFLDNNYLKENYSYCECASIPSDERPKTYEEYQKKKLKHNEIVFKNVPDGITYCWQCSSIIYHWPQINISISLTPRRFLHILNRIRSRAKNRPKQLM